MDMRKETGGLLTPDYSNMYPDITDVQDVITINVGGIRHEVLWKTLQSFPNSRLGKLPSPYVEKQQAKPQNKAAYFDRNPIIFNSILDLYRTGKLCFNDNICPESLSEELQFWLISEDNISACCQQKFLMKKMKTARRTENQSKLKENGEMTTSYICNILDNPSSSIPACIYSILSIFFVLLFLLAMTLSSMPSLTYYDMNGMPIPNLELLVVKAVCIVFCALEFILRFIFSPNKLEFAKCWMNILDIVATLPCALHVLTKYISFTETDEEEDYEDLTSPATSYDSYDYNSYSIKNDFENSKIMMFLNFVSHFWIIWIFKLIRHSGGLQKFARILKNSFSEIFLLVQVLFVGVFFFGSIMYFCEKDEEGTGFVSLAQSFWWAIITMTTVGYGDISPYTAFGELLASFCAIFGVLSMFVPLAIIAINSAGLYREKKEATEMAEYKKGLKNAGNP